MVWLEIFFISPPPPILIHPSLGLGPIRRCSLVPLFKTPARPCCNVFFPLALIHLTPSLLSNKAVFNILQATLFASVPSVLANSFNLLYCSFHIPPPRQPITIGMNRMILTVKPYLSVFKCQLLILPSFLTVFCLNVFFVWTSHVNKINLLFLLLFYCYIRPSSCCWFAQKIFKILILQFPSSVVFPLFHHSLKFPLNC
jgi:hypothetical protein